LLLLIEISRIIEHEADEPNAVVDFLDAVAGQLGGEADQLFDAGRAARRR
jgi:hypothetical protein